MDAILIVPGLRGSGPEHWQNWFEARLPASRRVHQPDWETPDLRAWARNVRRAINLARGRVWLIAHSFGCLAAVRAAADRPDRVAGAMLVAPADPFKFRAAGLLPAGPLPFPSVVVASTNDPWMQLMNAAYLSERWGSRFWNLGAAGHINVDAGFGPWPEGLEIFRALRSAAEDGQGAEGVTPAIRLRAFQTREYAKQS